MYDVFISYARKDYVDEKGHVLPGNPVSRVMKSLSDAGISYWFDTQGIYSGDDFAEKIITSIEKSEIFVFLSTEHANHSPWTRKEIACAHELNKRIIPVRIDHSSYDKAVMFRIVDLDYSTMPVIPNWPSRNSSKPFRRPSNQKRWYQSLGHARTSYEAVA